MNEISMDRHEELQLLSAVLQGDRRAGRRFFERYNGTVELCVRKVLRGCGARSEEDVRDLIAEVWLSLLEDDKRPLRRFDPSRDIRVNTWIGLLARNKAIDRLRGRQERAARLEQPVDLEDEPTAERLLPCEELEERESRLIASRAMAQLKEEDRSFLEAWYLDGREPEELATELGISIGTVYSRRFKIQAKLARSIGRLCKPRRAPVLH